MDKYEEIEDIIAKKYEATTTTKKALGDFMLNEYHAVNVKSNNIDKKNYSPNIISAKKLLKWLLIPKNKYSLVFVDYKEVNGKIEIRKESPLIPIEQIDWSCLTIEAQGWGVIQKPKPLKLKKSQNRDQFLSGLKNAYKVYKAKEQKKWIEIERLLKKIK